jgi:hypothetical protein
MEQPRKIVWVREWIIFALSIGLGGHVALGLMLHDPTSELWRNIGWKAFFIGLFIYAAIQACRSIVVAIRSQRTKRRIGASRHS